MGIIPVTADKTLFEAMVGVGKAMANIEKKEYKAKDTTLTSVLGNVVSECYQEFELHSHQASDGKITLMDNHGTSIVSFDVPEAILSFEASGYNIIDQWLKYHSYAYYRKACSSEDIHDLFNLIGRIAEYQAETTKCDELMKRILESELVKPTK